ncbi:Na+/H+ antiporter subunit E [Advenella mimigardefordensis]|uniref:Putative K(+)/H(+) antiporter subunit E n=1 Tax=Advenella mimigardefordensis (strain DSM 17166 / LMG 22922 / DPN7) TaxID=1247726 RepID=W0PFD7_ADVMD|nr:Na+/H+ antiporter subunit E [Advenella mimigardefordensis]AHG64197.1 putative K(+)/H(+) antiporter subunit E [Advenella mimigardefordensis DPN7]
MKSWFSWLPMTMFLAVIWVLLADMPLGMGTLAFAGAASLIIVLMSRRLRPFLARPRRIWVILKLAGIVLADTFQSNVAAVKIILGYPKIEYTPGFVSVPLTLRDPHGLAILAAIINYAPGTLWAGFPESGEYVQLHILDLPQETDWAAFITERYEKPLKEIFE